MSKGYTSYVRSKQRRRMLGSVEHNDLKSIRQKALEIQAMVEKGIDPEATVVRVRWAGRKVVDNERKRWQSNRCARLKNYCSATTRPGQLLALL